MYLTDNFQNELKEQQFETLIRHSISIVLDLPSSFMDNNDFESLADTIKFKDFAYFLLVKLVY